MNQPFQSISKLASLAKYVRRCEMDFDTYAAVLAHVAGCEQCLATLRKKHKELSL